MFLTAIERRAIYKMIYLETWMKKSKTIFIISWESPWETYTDWRLSNSSDGTALAKERNKLRLRFPRDLCHTLGDSWFPTRPVCISWWGCRQFPCSLWCVILPEIKRKHPSTSQLRSRNSTCRRLVFRHFCFSTISLQPLNRLSKEGGLWLSRSSRQPTHQLFSK